MSRRTVLSLGIMLLAGTIIGFTHAIGPGNPTTVFASGFNDPCRMAFDASGNLFVAEVGVGQISWLAAGGSTPSLYSDAVADPRSIALDAFGDVLTSSVNDSAVYKISSDGQATKSFSVVNPRGITTGPDGSIWVAAVDSVHQFDAMGRHLQTIEVASHGVGAWGVKFSPAGELHMSSFVDVYKLVNGAPVAVATEQPTEMWSLAFDEQGNFYWTHRAVTPGDVGRVRMYDASGAILEDTFVDQLPDPCGTAFARNTDGTVSKRLLIAQFDGTILEANSAGVVASGFRVVGLELQQISETSSADKIVGAADDLSDDELRFLDVIGNNNGSFDVGDFRAYLIATDVVTGATAAAQ